MPERKNAAMMRTRRGVCAVVLLALLLALGGCKIDWFDTFDSNDDGGGRSDNTAAVSDTGIPGLDVAVSENDFPTTYRALKTAVSQQQAAAGLGGANVAEIDLQAPGERPAEADMQTPADRDTNSPRPTRVILYSDPTRTTPIINADRRAALDLPPAMLVYQDSSDDVGVAYGNGAYFRARYGLSGDDSDADAAVDALVENARSLAQAAAGNDVSVEGDADGIERAGGIVARDSDTNFPTTLGRLLDAIDADDSLALFTQIDQRAAALDAGLMLGDNDNRSTLVLLDAGPDAARLLSGGQTAGIDLPERMLVSEADDGTVTLYYNAPDYLVDRHDIADRESTVSDLTDRLSNLADTATAD